MKKLIITAGILIALTGVVIYAYVYQSKPADGQGGPRGGPTSIPVEIAPVTLGNIAQVVAITGSINARAEVEIYPKQAGELIELRVEKGDKVRAGQIIGRIDARQLEIQVKEAEADLVSAKAGYEKSASVAHVNSETDFKQARSDLDRLQATLQQAELDFRLQTKKTDVEIKKAKADLQIAKARLEAAVSGARTQEIEQIKVRKANAKRELDRLTELLQDEIIPQDQVEAAQLQYEIYSAQLSLLEEGTRPEDIAVLKAQVEVAQASLQAAEDNRTLIEIKQTTLVSVQAQVEHAQAAFEQSQTAKEAGTWEKELSQVEATVLRAQAVLSLNQQRLDEAVVRAPISGVISQRFLDRGDTASPTQAVVTIVDMDVVKVTAKVPGRDLTAMRVGSEALIKPDAYPGETFSGKVVFISPVIDRTSQTVDIEIEVANPDHRLKPGLFARIELTVAEHNGVPLIPVEALVKLGEETFVYVVNDGAAHRKQITAGISDSVQVEVVSGLKVGDGFILAGKTSLREGASVTLTEGTTLK